MKNRFAGEIVVDNQKNVIIIDGIQFPYWTEPDPEIELRHDGAIGILRIGLFADSIIYIGPDGKRASLVEPAPISHTEWARARAKEIVLEGLADVVTWLAECEQERQGNRPRPRNGAVPVNPSTLSYAATALEGSSDNGDRYAALQIRQALSEAASL